MKKTGVVGQKNLAVAIGFQEKVRMTRLQKSGDGYRTVITRDE